MNYLESLHDASARLIKITEFYDSSVKDSYAKDPAFINDTGEYAEDYSELTPARLDKLALSIKELYPELTIEISTDSAGAHMLFKVARDHVCCISTVENSIGLYDSFRANDDLGAALEHEPIYMGHLGKDWN